MVRVKHTKNELKAQRDALKRYQRYLPTLQMKKQQLQLELRQLEAQLEANAQQARAIESDLAPWIALFAEPFDFAAHLQLLEQKLGTTNVAGVNLPVLHDIVLRRDAPDPFATPAWVDEALAVLESLVRLRLQRAVLERQHELLAAELLVTSQRVNLFEKIKIPECRENIRTIRIFLGDARTLDVARAKIAKAKALERETSS